MTNMESWSKRNFPFLCTANAHYQKEIDRLSDVSDLHLVTTLTDVKNILNYVQEAASQNVLA